MKNPKTILSLSLVLLLATTLAASAQPQPWQWAEALGGDSAGITTSRLTVDPAGNTYLTGAFSGSAEFGSFAVGSAGGTDIYIVKMDTYGDVLWARSAGGAGADAGKSIVVDADGNAYVTGSIQGGVAFGSETLAGSGGQRAFLAKYDAAGSLQWVRAGGGSGAEASGVALDGEGNPRITGLFTGLAPFGALAPLSSAGSSDIFIAAYTTSGIEQWAVRAGGSGFGHQAEGGRALAVDASGDIYVSGSFLLTAQFGTSTVTAVGGQDVFVAKYSPAAEAWQWVRKGGGSAADFATDLKLDSGGNLYVAGIFSGSASFGGTAMTAGAGNFWDQGYFVSKYDSAGAFLWARDVAGVGYFAGHGIAVDADGNVYLAATFLGTATIASTTISSSGFDNMYMVKFGPDGTSEWVVHTPGDTYTVASNIAVDAYGSLYVAGWLLGTAEFDGTVLASASPNAYVAKMGLPREPLVELVEVRLDIRPGSCTNPLPTKSDGVLPVAVRGAEGLDLSLIDLTTVQIWRADGIGGAVAPLRSEFADVGECDLGADGMMDLVLKFDTAALVEGLELASLARGTEVELVISGALGEAAEFAGLDAILVR